MVSVVIPVYNVENYISDCLDSVINQTYKNLQIIIVDDGSTDNSGKICDEYAVKDDRITVVHQENQGAGAAKNTGLDLVDGDYLSLIDSDDYIDLDFYETLVSSMEKYGVDVVQCLFSDVFTDKSYERNYSFPSNKDRILDPKQFLFEMLYDWKYAIFCQKLFKTELLKDIRFPVGRKIDDEFFTYKLICNAKKIVNINAHLYNYRMRKSSVMNENNQFTLLKDRAECFIERYSYVSERFKTLSSIYYDNFASFISNCKEIVDSDEGKRYFQELESIYPIKKIFLIRKLFIKIKTGDFVYDSGNNGERFD